MSIKNTSDESRVILEENLQKITLSADGKERNDGRLTLISQSITERPVVTRDNLHGVLLYQQTKI